MYLVLGGGGTNGPTNVYGTDTADDEPQAKVITERNAITGSQATGFTRNAADSIEDAPWSAAINPTTPTGTPIFDVDPGERRGETTITFQYFAIPAVSNEAGSRARRHDHAADRADREVRLRPRDSARAPARPRRRPGPGREPGRLTRPGQNPRVRESGGSRFSRPSGQLDSVLVQPLASDDPAEIGGYRLRARLGAGGMGRVYLASTPAGRTVALKVVRPELSDDQDFRARFRQEIEAARRVHGLYTAQLLDADPAATPPVACHRLRARAVPAAGGGRARADARGHGVPAGRRGRRGAPGHPRRRGRAP